MSGDQVAIILDTLIPLDRGSSEVPGLSDETAADPDDQKRDEGIRPGFDCLQEQCHQTADRSRTGYSSDPSLNRLFGAQDRRKLMTSYSHADCESADIAHRGADKDQQIKDETMCQVPGPVNKAHHGKSV